jgi:hypothetical protein
MAGDYQVSHHICREIHELHHSLYHYLVHSFNSVNSLVQIKNQSLVYLGLDKVVVASLR